MQTNIEVIAAQVQQWRSQQSTKTSQLPTELQRKVVGLLRFHTWREIKTEVGVPTSRLAAWRLRHGEELGFDLSKRVRRRRGKRKKLPNSSNRAFLEIPMVSSQAPCVITSPQPAAPYDVEMQLPDGLVVRTHLATKPAAIAELAKQLVAALGSRS